MDAAEAKSRYAEAKRLHTAGRHTEALVLLDAVDAAHPNSKNILLAKAECLIALGDRDTAVRLCESMLSRQEDERARRVLAMCREAAAPGRASSPPDLPKESLSSPPARRSRRLLHTLPILFLVGAGAIGIAVEIMRRQMNPGEIAPAFTESEVSELAKARAQKRTAATEEEEAKSAAEDEAASKRAGYVVPESKWNLDATTGAPEWRPGIYRRLPCPGSWFDKDQAPRTVDMYIPMVYARQPDDLFPVVTISMPDLNPGFRGYGPWAEKQGVILVAINSSCNDCGWQSNRQAQLDAYNFLSNSSLRAHPQLNFSTGVSGGAQMSWIMAVNSPDMFAGVLMIAQTGFRESLLPPSIRVAYVNGDSDFNAEPINRMISYLHENGNEVHHEIVAGGHIEGPLNVRTKMLDWLLDAARKDLADAAAEAEAVPAEN